MKTRLLSGFLVVLGGGAAIVGCFEPSRKVIAETPPIVASPSPATDNSLSQQPQPVLNQNNATPVATLPTDLSPGVTEIAKLYQSNVSEDVLLAFINNYGWPFNATAEDIVYLNDLGVSDTVVTAVINHKPQGTDPTQNLAAAEPKQQAQAVAPAPAPVAVTAPLVPQESAPALITAAPATQVSADYFYETLSPYGSWVETQYGRCWRPAAVVTNPGWRPYCDRGHWIYTDSGWYWASDYSWGWATFHYGRWCSDVRYGWIWAPDTVWGPSWVSWRYNSDYCGWAPLPPLARYGVGVGFTYRSANVGISFEFGLTDSCYTFVPVHRFCDPHPYRYCAPRTSIHNIYNRTTVINNYTVINNKTVVNEGIGRKRIEAATKQPIQQVAIHDWPKNSGSATTPDRIHKVGKDLVVYKPQAPEAVKPRITPVKPTSPDNNASSGFSGRNHHNDNSRDTGPTASHGSGKTVSPSAGNTAVTLPDTGNQGHGKPTRATPAREPRLPQVATQPTRNETPTTQLPSVVPQRTPGSSSPRVSVGRPERDTVRTVEDKPKHVSPSANDNNWQSAPAPRNQGRSEVIATIPQAQAPLTPAPAQSPSRGNSPGHDAVSPGRGHQDRVESPRLSTPEAPHYSAPAQNAQTPTYHAQPMTPSVPRAPQQAATPHGQGQGGGQGASHERAPRSEKLVEKDSPNQGGGRGRF
ncbi:MAG: hypothetical protein JWM68_3909 [Verrucomicrobiales bacterium]|nr:hypothetical protein [Verrucomicrobiales bacterium]